MTSSEERPQPQGVQRQSRTVPIELLVGLVLLAVALTFRLASGSGGMNWLMPVALTYVLMAVGAYLLIRGFLGLGERMALRRPQRHGEAADLAVFLAIATGYVVLAPYLGFWLTSALMLFGCSVLFAPRRDRRTLLVCAVTALGICVVFYVLMLHVFYVPLPEGEWLPF